MSDNVDLQKLIAEWIGKLSRFDDIEAKSAVDVLKSVSEMVTEWDASEDLLRQAIEALRDVTNALESKIDTSEKFKRPYEHPLSAFDRARAVLTAYDKREQS